MTIPQDQWREKSMVSTDQKTYFVWMDALKAFAILGILLNHLVEGLGPVAWFTNPSEDWPALATRLQNFIPRGGSWLERLIYFLGWLGDSGPGVFILLSGLGLTLSAWRRGASRIDLPTFYRRRLLRIFPLYFTIHFFTLLLALLIFGPERLAVNIDTFLSFMGLRFKDGLFFYINPSWWFIWLLLQLYLVFPFLFRLLKKWGIGWFFLFTLGVTILSRGAGLEGIRYSNGLFAWMTGIFFGTRLAEFTLGMVLAVVLLQDRKKPVILFRSSWFLPLSFAVYLLGLGASLLWVGTMISNLLVTSGLCGIFYGLWQWGIKKHVPSLTKPIVWIGMHSFGVFLLHQAPMIWSGQLINDPFLSAVVMMLIIMISFPIAGAMEDLAGKATVYASRVRIGSGLRWGGTAFAVLLLPLLVVLSPVRFSPYSYALWSILMIASVLLLVVLETRIPVRQNYLVHLLLLTAVFASILKIFILPPGYGICAVALGGTAAGGIVLLYLLGQKRWRAWIVSGTVLGVALLTAEVYLRKERPLETALRWGEYPALQEHPTRIFSLKPNLDIRLKYNNYDYPLKTNSQGLTSAETALERATPATFRILVAGDAFSMPEGVAYEDAYPHLLEQGLREVLRPRAVEVINGGVTGYGPVETLSQLSELVPAYRPEIVIYQFFINEFEEVNASREERLRSIGLISDLSGMEKEIYGSQVLAYEKKYERRLKELLTRRESAFRYGKTLLRFYEKKDGICNDDLSLRKVEEHLSEIKDKCNDHGAVLLVCFVPGQIAVSKPEDIAYFPHQVNLGDTALFDMELPLQRVRTITGKLEIPFLDLTPALKNHARQPVYFPESWHWNREGHKVAAGTILKELADKRLFGTAEAPGGS